MAQQSRKRRRRKHRGTQGGSIDRRGPRGRPRTREEAKARARKRPAVDRRDLAPTWGTAAKRGIFGAAIFFALMVLLFKQPVGGAVALSALMLAMYVPLGYYVDRFFYQRRRRQLQARRAAERAERHGGGG